MIIMGAVHHTARIMYDMFSLQEFYFTGREFLASWVDTVQE